MIRLDERELVRTVAKRWREQYPRGCGKMSKGIHAKLVALDTETATAADVAAIIGNESWVRVEDCSDCGAKDLKSVTQLGEEPDYESQTAYVCDDCLRKALALAT